MSTAIEVTQLRKSYRTLRGRNVVALDGLTMSVERGGVYGFLGPNGAGKTTAIRCMLGLIRPTSGSASILGHAVPRTLRTVLPKVGAIVETPALFPHFTGRKNLRIFARMGGIDEKRIDEVLSVVELTDRADSKVKGYSLGMRQRLGLAATLLKDPELLILDEPANGLDPAGIRAMRNLLRRLGSDGRTVFLSSHLLSEIEQTCDAVALLSRGRCIAQGTVAEVIGMAAAGNGFVVRVDDLEQAIAVLTAEGFQCALSEGSIRVSADAGQGSRINELLGRSGIWLGELTPIQASLEDVFMELTSAEPEVRK